MNILQRIINWMNGDEEREVITITEKGRQFVEDNNIICMVCNRVLPGYGFNEAGICQDCQH